MANFVKETDESKVSKVVKFEEEEGLFNTKKGLQEPDKILKKNPNVFFVYTNDKINGNISGFFENNYGKLMFVETKDENLMIPLSTDLNIKVHSFLKKQKGDSIEIKYLGRQPSPKNKAKSLFKFDVK